MTLTASSVFSFNVILIGTNDSVLLHELALTHKFHTDFLLIKTIQMHALDIKQRTKFVNLFSNSIK